MAQEDEETHAIDGSSGPLIERTVVVWRRLEPGDVRTPGTEEAPESPYLEAKLCKVGIARERHADLARLWKIREAVLGKSGNWMTRYEPAGVTFTLGAAFVVGIWLDYLPEQLLTGAGALMLAGVAIGVITRLRKRQHERATAAKWSAREERAELARHEKILREGWERFGKNLKEAGFRTDVRVGDLDEADRLCSIDTGAIIDPATWEPSKKADQVRYIAVLPGGRAIERVAEVEDDPTPAAAAPPEKAERAEDAEEEDDGEEDEDEDDKTAKA
ncbi:MAG: hypothetical protein K8H88_29850 [Sandaracinaceae bacterium]|nr:hypothetical protein [Sandaracinaceae bacterium]